MSKHFLPQRIDDLLSGDCYQQRLRVAREPDDNI